MVNIHTGQDDQQKVIELYGEEGDSETDEGALRSCVASLTASIALGRTT